MELCRQVLYAKDVLESRYNLSKGDAVILAANKQLSFVSVYFACHLLGVTVLPLAPDINEKRLSLIAGRTAPKLSVGLGSEKLICEQVGLEAFEGFMDACDITTVTFPDMDNVADIIFTTGTTGEPKGVTLSQKNIEAAAKNINTFIQNTSDDVEMLALPISHSFGLGRLRCAISNGQTVVILGSFANMKRFFRFMEEYQVTGFGMVPASWAMIRKLSDLKIAEYAKQLHYIEIGSAPMPLEEKLTLIDILPQTRICMHYGLTEASRSAFMEFHEEKDFLDTIGKQSPNMYIEIRDENGVRVADGTEGEICVKGDAVTAGYYKMPEVNETSFFGEYFRTGDWGVRSSDGHIRLCSRKKELINVGGKKVSPLEVEELLMKLDFVDDCACIAIPDPGRVLGEVVKAYIVTTQSDRVVKEEINRAIAPQIEDYKLPVEYEVTDAIPKTSSGKVQRLLLKK
jgi:long-chain acyl-CoA synthetase